MCFIALKPNGLLENHGSMEQIIRNLMDSVKMWFPERMRSLPSNEFTSVVSGRALTEMPTTAQSTKLSYALEYTRASKGIAMLKHNKEASSYSWLVGCKAGERLIRTPSFTDEPELLAVRGRK